jgi:hypothetical protein
MTWTPESGALTKPAVNIVGGVELSSFDIWDEFIAGWFNGAAHVVNDAPTSVTFPVITVGFQQALVPPTLEGVHLNATMIRKHRSNRKPWGGADSNYEDITWKFWLRSKVVAKNPQKASGQVMLAADKLFLVLNTAVLIRVLTEKGITNVRSDHPRMISDTTHAMRTLDVSAKLLYRSDYVTT